MDRMREGAPTREALEAGIELEVDEMRVPTVAPDPIQTELENRLGTSLQAARGNERIRQRLGEIVRDRERFSAILRAFGPSHAHVLDLLAIARHVRARHGELPRLGAQALAIRHQRTLLPNQS